MKKMTDNPNKQFFQIIRVTISKKYTNIDCLNDEKNLPKMIAYTV